MSLKQQPSIGKFILSSNKWEKKLGVKFKIKFYLVTNFNPADLGPCFLGLINEHK